MSMALFKAIAVYVAVLISVRGANGDELADVLDFWLDQSEEGGATAEIEVEPTRGLEIGNTEIAADADDDTLDWRLCLPAGSRIPHAHDKHHRVDVRAIDRTCLVAAHVAHFGSQCVPRTAFARAAARGSAAAKPTAGCADAPGHGKPFGEQGQPRGRIPESDGCLDSPTFLREHVGRQQPVVMRGCADAHPARRKWTDAYLSRVAGAWHGLRSNDTPPLRDWLKTYNARPTHKQGETYSVRTLPLSDAQERSAHGPHGAALLGDLRFPAPLLAALPMFGEPRTEERRMQLKFWLNAGRKNSKIHFDSHDALLTQLDGQKEVLLAAPTDSHLLYLDFPICHATQGCGGPAVDQARHNRRLNFTTFGYSPIAPNFVDLCDFPCAAQATVLEVTLEPGDMLYIPPVWWHLVWSLPRTGTPWEDGGAGRTLAVTFQGRFMEFQQQQREDAAWLGPAHYPHALSAAALEGAARHVAEGREGAHARWRMADWLEEGAAAPPLDCVRLASGSRQGSLDAVEFAERGFRRRPDRAVPCATWARRRPFATRWEFPFLDQALSVAEKGGAVWAGPLGSAPPDPDVAIQCRMFAVWLFIWEPWWVDRRPGAHENFACEVMQHSAGARFAEGLSVSDAWNAAVDQLRAMLYGFHGDVMTVPATGEAELAAAEVLRK